MRTLIENHFRTFDQEELQDSFYIILIFIFTLEWIEKSKMLNIFSLLTLLPLCFFLCVSRHNLRIFITALPSILINWLLNKIEKIFFQTIKSKKIENLQKEINSNLITQNIYNDVNIQKINKPLLVEIKKIVNINYSLILKQIQKSSTTIIEKLGRNESEVIIKKEVEDKIFQTNGVTSQVNLIKLIWFFEKLDMLTIKFYYENKKEENIKMKHFYDIITKSFQINKDSFRKAFRNNKEKNIDDIKILFKSTPIKAKGFELFNFSQYFIEQFKNYIKSELKEDQLVFVTYNILNYLNSNKLNLEYNEDDISFSEIIVAQKRIYKKLVS